jgi:hypothetical protein
MKPYSKIDLSREEEIYNYRPSRARRTVECAFGIIAAKWRLLNKCTETEPDKADSIVKCICSLHNIIIERESIYPTTTSLTPQDENITNGK